jgi:acetate kinase
MKVLVINAGSSSLKYQLMDTDTRTVLAKGLCERIGIDGRLTHKVPAKDLKLEFEIAMPTHAEAIQSVLDALTSAEHGVIRSMSEIDAVGHRCGHGGEKFAASARIDADVMAALEECIPLAPCTIPPTSPASRLPGRYALHSHGGRVRHRLPSDDARQELYLCPALRVL